MLVVMPNDGPRRFGEVHRAVEGISKKVLTDTLRALERDGTVERSTDGEGVVRHGFTALGRTLHEPPQALRAWAESHVEDVHAAQDRYDEAILRSAQTTRGPVRALAHLRGGSDRGCPPPRAPAGRARGPRGSAPTADPARS